MITLMLTQHWRGVTGNKGLSQEGAPGQLEPILGSLPSQGQRLEWFSLFLAVRCWANDLTALCHSFFFCHMEVIMAFALQGSWNDNLK